MSVEHQRLLIEEFNRDPLGPHSAALQRLLHRMRGQSALGKHVLICVKPGGPWMLGRLGARGEPVQAFSDRVFADLASAERAVFSLRWEALFGEQVR